MFLWTVISCLWSELWVRRPCSRLPVLGQKRAGEEPDLGEKGKLPPGAYGWEHCPVGIRQTCSKGMQRIFFFKQCASHPLIDNVGHYSFNTWRINEASFQGCTCCQYLVRCLRFPRDKAIWRPSQSLLCSKVFCGLSLSPTREAIRFFACRS